MRKLHSSLHRLRQRIWDRLGPGLITGASDDDPSGVATYSQAGAQFGYQFLWLAPYTFPLMAAVQEMCARIGIVTRQGLAVTMKKRFPRWFLFLCVGSLVVANTINIGADIGAMAASIQLLLPVPFLMLAGIVTLTSLLLEIFTCYKTYARYLKWLTMGLLLYVATAVVVHLPISTILHSTFIPTLTWSRDSIVLVCGILGTTISPYLFFWQASQEVEELREKKQMKAGRLKGVVLQELHVMREDVWFGMFFSNLIMFFIIAVTAATLNRAGILTISTAAEAARALQPLAGQFAFVFFTFGIIGTGLLALPVLAGSSAYALADTFGWRQGLNNKFKQSPLFYGVIMGSFIVGLLINMLGLDPIKLLIYTAVLNGIVSAPLILAIVLIARQKKIMGVHRSHPVSTLIGLVISLIMGITGLATIWFLFKPA